MPDDELALVRNALCTPTREPLLALAAWMESHGEPERAEYLRLLPEWYDVVEGANSEKWPQRKRLVALIDHPRLAPPFPGHGHPLPWLPTEARFNSWSDFENH